jgi:DNA replication protein DnaC
MFDKLPPVMEEEPPYYECEMCHDMGFVSIPAPVGHKDFGKTCPCPSLRCPKGNEQRQARLSRMFEAARIPKIYMRLDFDTFLSLSPDDRKSKMLGYAACRQFAEQAGWVDIAAAYDLLGAIPPKSDYRRSLVLYGPYGTGKTGVVIGAARHLLNSGASVLYLRAYDLFQEVQKRYSGEYDEDATTALDQIKTAAYLIIDDCNLAGVDANSGAEKQADKIGILPTIITCNVDQAGFRSMWGGRTAESACDMAHWIKMGGTTLRNTFREHKEHDL